MNLIIICVQLKASYIRFRAQYLFNEGHITMDGFDKRIDSVKTLLSLTNVFAIVLLPI